MSHRLGLAMLLVGTGAECAGAYGTRYAEAAQRVAENQGGEVIYQEYQDGKLTYEVTAPRIDLARAVEMRQGARFMPLVACPEAPRPPANPRSKSGQRRAHARWGR